MKNGFDVVEVKWSLSMCEVIRLKILRNEEDRRKIFVQENFSAYNIKQFLKSFDQVMYTMYERLAKIVWNVKRIDESLFFSSRMESIRRALKVR